MSVLPTLRDDLVAGIARRRRRRRRAAAATLPLAVGAAVALALLPTGSSRSPAEALAQAADAASGHIAWTMTQTPKVPTADGSTEVTNTVDVRYEGDDVAIDIGNAVRQADGTQRTFGPTRTRIVDGVLYYGARGAEPVRLAAGAGAGRWLADQARALAALAAAVRSAAGVTTQTTGDVTTYTATIDARGLKIPSGPGVPVGFDLATGKPVAPTPSELTMMWISLDGQAALEIAVTDGTVTAFTITEPDGHFTVRAELSDLGRPQAITAPASPPPAPAG